MGALEDTFFQSLAYACTETRRVFDQYVGMSQARRQLLTVVAQQGEVSHAALQQQLSLDGATVTRLVKQFEAGGMLSRRLDPHNNRYTLVSLTESGHALVAALRVEHSAFQARLLDGITREEQEVMVRVLQRLRTNIAQVQNESQEVKGTAE